jgi:hypothetical protein
MYTKLALLSLWVLAGVKATPIGPESKPSSLEARTTALVCITPLLSLVYN